MKYYALDKIFDDVYNSLKESVLECKSNNLALSGGLDSSIIAYFLKERKPRSLAIIAEDFLASDLTYCQLISKHFELPLKIENVKTDKILEAVEQTIKILKNFNDIEIRNSVVMYMTIKSIKDQGDDSLITGDGSDELFAGYNFFLNKTPEELEKEQERIWNTMHFPSHVIGEHLGIKIESPFLNQKVVNLAKKIPAKFKVAQHDGTTYGKWILREIFQDKIPSKIAWRQKSAMQDGSGTSGLTELFNSVISDDMFESKKEEIAKTDEVVLRSKESMHYYETYRKFFDVKKSTEPDNTCPYCKGPILENSKFCRMCGAWPI